MRKKTGISNFFYTGLFIAIRPFYPLMDNFLLFLQLLQISLNQILQGSLKWLERDLLVVV